ncbi:Hydrolase, alpha/beta fold family functionally coupled to Phosphoribulokinase [hydrothermal vent metagenome]|uniref:Hydrolase, alpha/beta fold family functionally coupled to Phosphoribulokinase n=1 Tax=hydrothermal vent metagenome TaxID=652676 RepID=A0A3B0XD64_9ZZZZ
MEKTDFKPTWWLRSPHLQTLWPVFFRKRHELDLTSEQVELDDGDFLDLCWSKKTSEKIVLILHGLEGDIDSHYINGIIYQLEQSKFKPVLMHFRGCSGRVNRLPRAYHSGETEDLAFIVEHIKNVTGNYPYAAVAYSLGGNVLLKWLGETGEKNPLKKAVAVSVPFKLHDAARRLEQGVSKIYREHLLTSLRKTYIRKFKKIKSPLNVDVSQLKSFWDYDDRVTAPLHGFSGAQEYYDKCSSRQFLKNIKVPTRIIHSLDDPFMFKLTPPDNRELNNNVNFLLTNYGGHVGFISGAFLSKLNYWSEEKIIEFIA